MFARDIITAKEFVLLSSQAGLDVTVTVITKYFYWDTPSSLHVVITLIMVAREVITALIAGVICDLNCDTTTLKYFDSCNDNFL